MVIRVQEPDFLRETVGHLHVGKMFMELQALCVRLDRWWYVVMFVCSRGLYLANHHLCQCWWRFHLGRRLHFDCTCFVAAAWLCVSERLRGSEVVADAPFQGLRMLWRAPELEHLDFLPGPLFPFLCPCFAFFPSSECHQLKRGFLKVNDKLDG